MKRLAALALAAAFVLSLAACGGGKELTLVTGSASGTYYGFGAALAKVAGEKTKTKIAVKESGGSKANMEALKAGTAQLAFVQSDVAAYACNGTRLFENNRIEGCSVVAQLYMEPLQIVTLDPEIRSVADLAGKNVSVGAAGSGVYFNAVDVLNAYGLDVNTGINPAFQSFTDSVDALLDGRIAAAFIVAGAPTEAVARLAERRPIHLVGLDEEHIAGLVENSPYYSRSVVPQGTYGLSEDAVTVAVAALIAARDDVPEEDVYGFVSAVFENAAELAAAHDKGAELDPAFAASYAAVPYHPGAAKYFAEKGLSVPK